MKIVISFLCQICFLSIIWSQDSLSKHQNSVYFNQSLFDFGGNEVFFSLQSSSIGYKHYSRNIGFGLEFNRIQMKNEGLQPIGPVDEISRRDNLRLFYVNTVLSYRFTNFCFFKNLGVELDLAPSFLIGGKNDYYALETGGDSLIHNSRWKDPDRIEYETKFNILGRVSIDYMVFEHFKFGVTTSSYLKYIAPKFMSLNIPFSPGPRQIDKSSFWSLLFTYTF